MNKKLLQQFDTDNEIFPQSQENKYNIDDGNNNFSSRVSKNIKAKSTFFNKTIFEEKKGNDSFNGAVTKNIYNIYNVDSFQNNKINQSDDDSENI
jgi:hypothetical protein